MKNLDRIESVVESVALVEDVNRELFTQLEDAFLASRGQQVNGLKQSLSQIKNVQDRFLDQDKSQLFDKQLTDVMSEIVNGNVEKKENRERAFETFLSFLKEAEALLSETDVALSV